MRYLFIILSLSFSISLISQDSLINYSQRTFEGERPKIGLVLSGGGAKGTAHVGVLKVLDSLGITPDFITGTSMGSIVGGLYSIGYTVEDLENLTNSLVWKKYLTNITHYRSINMVEKEDFVNYFEFPVKRWKPNLPQGAIKGQDLELLFNQLTSSVAGDTIFDNFYIPYRAVAVDIIKGKPYVFSSGSLSMAMRSSMSIPSIMNPVDYRGMLLVDGGLMVNFPVEICRSMGADIIIGVYTGAELMPKERLNSMLDIMKQSSFIASINNAENSKKLVDIYIEPYLSDRSAANFDESILNVERGYAAAIDNITELQKLKNYLDKYPQKAIKEVDISKKVYISNSNVVFEDDKAKLSKIIDKNFEQYNNEKLNTQSVDSSIHYLYGTRLFKKLTYDFSPSKIDSGAILQYRVKEEDDKHLLLSVQYKTETKMGVNIGFRYRNIIFPGSKIEAKFRLSENPGAKVQVFSYLNSNVKNGIDASYYYRTYKIPFYAEKVLVGKYSAHYHKWSSAYHHYNSSDADFNFGIGHERVYYNKIIDLETFSYSKITNISTHINLQYVRNTLNKKYFTDKGSLFNINTKFYLQNYFEYYLPQDTAYVDLPDYEKDTLGMALNVMLNYKSFISIGKKLVVTNDFDAFVGMGSIYTTWVGGVNPDEDFQLPFWGIIENGMVEGNGMIYRIGLRYNFFNKLYISGKVNGAFFADDIFEVLLKPDEPDAEFSSIFRLENYKFGGGLQLSYNSVIGPISFTITKSSDSSVFWSHLLIGYRF
ncbi:MAG: patatin-like phospholipase family protein [Bacteroidales bacterium]|nr:patatin-like phospholipase family protein [Bacteroidales bacterium]